MRRRKKIATAAMISVTPIDMEIIAAVVGLCFGTRDTTQIVSTVAGTDPAAKKHDGISFILFDMASKGVSTKPILLISGFGAHRVLAAGSVVGVEVADDKAAAVEKQQYRRRAVIGWRPVDPDVDRAGRPVDAAVLHAQFRVELAPRQIPQPLPRHIDTVIE